jgi:uncharacterized protein YbgA (DUF1722 family)/uncharacterized protein YbbK (DUF523 family)
MESRIKLGISACLLGQKVRYDGGHSHDPFLTDTLGQYVEYVPVCPEVECGLGVPREALRLVGKPDSPHLVTLHTNQDFRGRMVKWAKKRLFELEKEGLFGFIFKSNSPSSGMEKVKVYNEKGMPPKKRSGIFAGIFMERFPLVPVEDEGRLHDPELRENFIERIFVLKGWREMLEKKRSMENLAEFHTRQRLMALSHSQKHHRLMENVVDEAKELSIKERYGAYETLLLDALKLKTTPKKNGNVLKHIMRYLKKQLLPEEKQEVHDIIEEYRKGCMPLIVPITLMNHYAQKYELPYLSKQSYLQRHPIDLQMKNHA